MVVGVPATGGPGHGWVPLCLGRGCSARARLSLAVTVEVWTVTVQAAMAAPVEQADAGEALVWAPFSKQNAGS